MKFKKKKMKRIVIILTIGFFAQALLGQEPKFRPHAAYLDYNISYMTKNTLGAGMDGTNHSISFIFEYAKNRVGVDYLSGTSGIIEIFPRY